MRVLVADKDPYDLAGLRSGLSAGDLEVIEAVDGSEVVTLAREHDPDAIVVGSSLGQMGGFAVSRELKRLAVDGVIRPIKVIVLLERSADAWQAKEAGADAWLVKPVDDAIVEQLVRELVPV